MNRPIRPDDIDPPLVAAAAIRERSKPALRTCWARRPAAAQPRCCRQPGRGASLTEAYRARGYLKARLDPLGLCPVGRGAGARSAPARRRSLRAAAARIAALEAAYRAVSAGTSATSTTRRGAPGCRRRPRPHSTTLPSDTERVQILTQLALAPTPSRKACAPAFRPAKSCSVLGGAETFIVLLETLLSEAGARQAWKRW